MAVITTKDDLLASDRAFKHYAKADVAIKHQTGVVTFLNGTRRSIHNEDINYRRATFALKTIYALGNQLNEEQSQLNLKVARDTAQGTPHQSDLEKQGELRLLKGSLRATMTAAERLKKRYAPNITWKQWAYDHVTSTKAKLAYGAVLGLAGEVILPVAKAATYAGLCKVTMGLACCPASTNTTGGNFGTFTYPNGTTINGNFSQV